MKQEQLTIPDETIVSFTAKELGEVIKYLGKGSFDFVSPVISLFEGKMVESYKQDQAQTLEEPTKPIGGGGGSPIKPK